MENIPRIFQAGGGWGNVNGPGLLMIRAVTSGLLASVFMGMTGASIGAFIWDTATLPFLVSACTGFVFGAVGFYRDAVRKAMRSLELYPRLLQLHLHSNFSHRGFDTWSLEQLRSANFSNWQLESMLLASWATASPIIERIREGQEDALVAQHIEERFGTDKYNGSRE